MPVSEVENILLLPAVSRAILELDELDDTEVEVRTAQLEAAVFADALDPRNVNEVVLGHCRRRIDRMLKLVDLSPSKTVADLQSRYKQDTSALDVKALADEIESKIHDAVTSRNLSALLAVYDRKRPLFALAAKHLRDVRVKQFSSWIMRAVRGTRDDRLRKAIVAVLPTIEPSG